MEGISKERLIEIDPWAYGNQQDLLNAILLQCKELDLWMPIDKPTLSLSVNECEEIAIFLFKTDFHSKTYKKLTEFIRENSISKT